jgi:hypothetical protein
MVNDALESFALDLLAPLSALVFAACVLTALSGGWLLLHPRSFAAASRFFNRWISFDSLVRRMDYMTRVERFVYRHARPVGALICLASAYTLYIMAFRYDRASFVGLLGRRSGTVLTEAVVDAAGIFLALAMVFALAIGVFLMVRPSLLKGFEAASNRWLSTRRGSRVLDVMRYGPDRLLARYPRPTGLVILIASAYGIIGMAEHLWR